MSYYKQLPFPIKSIYVMRNKLTGEFVSCNNRESWGTTGAAKLSYNASAVPDNEAKGAFDRQDVYEIINVLELCK